MKIVADENIPYLEAFFQGLGEVTALPGRQMSAEQVRDGDILLVRSVTPVNAGLLAGSRVKFVGTCTIGTDHLDTDYLASENIAYASAPGCNAGGVLQYVLSVLASLEDSWFEKKIGVIGCGNVGSRVVNALGAIGVQVRVYDPFLASGSVKGLTDLGDVLSCDVIAMHTPFTRTPPFPTHHLINRHNLPLLKPGAVLLNAGRGGAIDNQALLQFLTEGAELRVILDVWEHEPAIDLELMNLCAFATPHIAGYSHEGKVKGSAMIYAALAKFLGTPENAIEQHTARVLDQAFGPPSELHCGDLAEAILKSYCIREDDLRTRSHLTSRDTVAVEFDRLRKSYPERREFGHFKVHTRNHELRRTLSAIGFL